MGIKPFELVNLKRYKYFIAFGHKIHFTATMKRHGDGKKVAISALVQTKNYRDIITK